VSLYNKGVDLSTIQRIFSLGMLGSAKKRRLVPTRWSISATDDIVSSYLVENTATNNVVDRFEVYKYSHLGNYYSIILIPDQLWSFEMQEVWFDSQGNLGFAVDFEDANGLQQYPSYVGGAYFASKLAVAEHLSKRKRKAAALVLREIHSDEYVVPVGVWQIREGIRHAFDNPFLKKEFDSLGDASKYACSTLSVSGAEWAKNSKLYRNYKRSQLRISQFFSDIQ
jgi:DNA repair protein NreA